MIFAGSGVYGAYTSFAASEFESSQGHEDLARAYWWLGFLNFASSIASLNTGFEILSAKITAKTVTDPSPENVNDVEITELSIQDSQLGKKWGKHKFDYPNMKSYNEYKNLAQEVFSNPDKIVIDTKNGEYYYIKGNDLLRITIDGDFVSLYPFDDIPTRVNTAISEGGLFR